MDNQIKEVINVVKQIPLSNADINRILNEDTHIFTYPKLFNMNHIDEAFDRHGRCIMLYLTEPKVGHWVTMLRKGNNIEFYDPYGFKPDTQGSKLNISKATNKYFRQDENRLVNMITDAGYKLQYNKKRAQEYKSGVNTCGRWCVLRLIHKDKSLKQFNSMLNSITNEDGVKLDDVVSLFTHKLH